ncbi:MAG: hypothetical protein ABL921_16170 [Pirellula sp.]
MSSEYAPVQCRLAKQSDRWVTKIAIRIIQAIWFWTNQRIGTIND